MNLALVNTKIANNLILGNVICLQKNHFQHESSYTVISSNSYFLGGFDSFTLFYYYMRHTFLKSFADTIITTLKSMGSVAPLVK